MLKNRSIYQRSDNKICHTYCLYKSQRAERLYPPDVGENTCFSWRFLKKYEQFSPERQVSVSLPPPPPKSVYVHSHIQKSQFSFSEKKNCSHHYQCSLAFQDFFKTKITTFIMQLRTMLQRRKSWHLLKLILDIIIFDIISYTKHKCSSIILSHKNFKIFTALSHFFCCLKTDSGLTQIQ